MKISRVGTKTRTSAVAHTGEQGFWPSYADMMSSVALVLFFLMLLAYIQNMMTGNQLLSTQEALENTQAELYETIGEVEDAQQTLAELNTNLDTIRDMLESEQSRLAQSESMLEAYEGMIAQQQFYLFNTQQDLEEMKGQMQTIAVLRLSILERIKEAIHAVMGTDAAVEIAENGSLVLGESLFFDYNSDRIKADGKSLLNELAKSFSLFLSNPLDRQYVDAIVISGHTDSKGTAAYNRDLSTRRANAVVDYLLENNSEWLGMYDSYFSAAGYGATRPRDTNDTDEGRQNNRRIEISLIIRDETVLQIVNEYLNKEMPNATLP